MRKFTVPTRQREELVDITEIVNGMLSDIGSEDGVCHLWCPHTTAGLTVNEGADPDVKRDILFAFGKIVPFSGYHHSEGNSPAHVKSILTGQSLLLPCCKGRLSLGVWQAVYFCEFDGPRTRNIFLTVLPAFGDE